MKKIFIFILFLVSFKGWAKNCTEAQLKEVLKKDTKIELCFSSKNIISKGGNEQIVVIRNEVKNRGIGIEVYSINGNKNKLMYEDFGLGQALGSLIVNNHKSHFFINDINGDGLKEIGLNVLNERTTLFFLYRYDDKNQKFENIKFNKKMEKNFKELDRLVGTLDYPIKMLPKSIQVFYEKDKFMTYELKNGAFFQK